MRTILIVEDSETCAETLQIALESMPGLKTQVLQNLGAALAALRDENSNIAALVTDLNMPRRAGLKDGFELIRQLRAERRYASLPVLLISGDSDPQLPQRALAHGADAFFSKPYSPAAVRRKLEQLLC
jgi:two-component system, chemotaxis family, chemotaxis protein CheY